MMEAANYQEFQSVSRAALEMEGDRRRPVPQTKSSSLTLLYRILFAVQFISVLIIVVCGLAAIGSFG